MLPFLIYFVAALATGLHLYTLLSLTAYGAASNPLEFVALAGCLGLLAAAYLSLYKPQVGARVALLASLLLWCFYGPAIANNLRMRKDHSSTSSLRPAPARPELNSRSLIAKAAASQTA